MFKVWQTHYYWRSILLNRYIYYFNALLSKEFKVSYQYIYIIQSGFLNAYFKQGDYKVRKKQVIKDKFVRENAANVLQITKEGSWICLCDSCYKTYFSICVLY